MVTCESRVSADTRGGAETGVDEVVPSSGSRRPLAEAVFNHLFDAIVSGRLAPGSSLPPERALTEEFGVNRQVVREAIKQLVHLGLVVQEHGNGNIVADWRRSGTFEVLPAIAARSAVGFGGDQFELARSLLELRQSCGTHTAPLCAARCTPELVDQLGALVGHLAVGVEPIERFRLSMKFWALVAEGSGNVAFQLMHNSMARSMVPIGMLMSHVCSRVPGDVADYQQLVDAMAACDPQAAAIAAARVLRIEPTEMARAAGLFDEGYNGVAEPMPASDSVG